jgi:acyl-CoA thioester hydrolase
MESTPISVIDIGNTHFATGTGHLIVNLESDLRSGLDGYPVVLTLPVLWGDQDAFEHVNNTVYLRWFESARILYCDRVGLSALRKTTQVGMILASITCHYRYPVTYPDTIHVGARVSRIGRSSLTMDHLLVSEAARGVAAEGTSTLVVYDYKAARSHQVPEPLRAAIESLEGRIP